jgi:hypothetical protein
MHKRYAMFTPELIAEVKQRVANGEYQHNIAADIGCNQGRISEIKNDAEWVQKVLDK